MHHECPNRRGTVQYYRGKKNDIKISPQWDNFVQVTNKNNTSPTKGKCKSSVQFLLLLDNFITSVNINSEFFKIKIKIYYEVQKKQEKFCNDIM